MEWLNAKLTGFLSFSPALAAEDLSSLPSLASTFSWQSWDLGSR